MRDNANIIESKINIAVNAILIFNNKFLLLHRTNKPICWGPPGGRLECGEKLVDGVKREVKEETGLNCRVLLPVSVWEGIHEGIKMISISYVCKSESNSVQLSDEHDNYVWVSKDEIGSWRDKTDFEINSWPIYIECAEIVENNQATMTRKENDDVG